MLCEQIVNADQMNEEILGAIYLGIKKTSSLGTNSFSCKEACYQVILPRLPHQKLDYCSFMGKNLVVVS
jgi:hypothetical protein